jgi:3-oxoadipate enol-lactonase
VADLRMWDPLVPLLADSHRVVRYDARGFGGSPLPPGRYSHVRDLGQLLDDLGLGPVALVGASGGGPTALGFAALHPDRVTALALLAPAFGDHDWSREMEELGEREEALLESGDLDGAVQLMVSAWVTDPAARELVADMQRRAFQLALGTEAEEEDEEFELSAVRAPTLIVVGDRDYADFARIGERLADELPRARLETMSGVGHLMALERPLETANLLRPFLGSNP